MRRADDVAIQCRELVSANAEVCRVLYDKITAEVSSGQHAQVKSQLAEWDWSHDAYLFALRLVGLPLVRLERPIVPPLQSMTIEPSEETITVKSVRDHIATFSEDSRQGLHQGAVLLHYYLALWATGMGVSIAIHGRWAYAHQLHLACSDHLPGRCHHMDRLATAG
jgi:hypothetical protein